MSNQWSRVMVPKLTKGAVAEAKRLTIVSAGVLTNNQ